MPLRLKPAVICFSSLIGAGKSSLTVSLCEFLGWPHTSFGDYVRETARARGLGDSREILQQVGEELVTTSIEPFTRAVISQIAWQQGCTIDGLRHVQVLDMVKKIVTPLSVVVVFIEIEERVRRQRLFDRGMTEAEIDAADRHTTEAQVRTVIRENADLRVDGNKNTPQVVNEIMTRLSERLC